MEIGIFSLFALSRKRILHVLTTVTNKNISWQSNRSEGIGFLKLSARLTLHQRRVPITSTDASHDELFTFRQVTCSEVRSIISSMPTNRSPGPDEISMRVIKDGLPVILGPLTTIINCSLATSTFPEAWKNAEIIPLLKEGNHEVASKNRPLSLLAVASKVCERVALTQFGSYLLKNKH